MSSSPHAKLTEKQRLEKELHLARINRDGYRAVLAHLANPPADADAKYIAQWQQTKAFLENHITNANNEGQRLTQMLQQRASHLSDGKRADERRERMLNHDMSDSPISHDESFDIPAWMQ